jgi:hypothetical protein
MAAESSKVALKKNNLSSKKISKTLSYFSSLKNMTPFHHVLPRIHHNFHHKNTTPCSRFFQKSPSNTAIHHVKIFLQISIKIPFQKNSP